VNQGFDPLLFGETRLTAWAATQMVIGGGPLLSAQFAIGVSREEFPYVDPAIHRAEYCWKLLFPC